jgi:hypothetical protein
MATVVNRSRAMAILGYSSVHTWDKDVMSGVIPTSTFAIDANGRPGYDADKLRAFRDAKKKRGARANVQFANMPAGIGKSTEAPPDLFTSEQLREKLGMTQGQFAKAIRAGKIMVQDDLIEKGGKAVFWLPKPKAVIPEPEPAPVAAAPVPAPPAENILEWGDLDPTDSFLPVVCATLQINKLPDVRGVKSFWLQDWVATPRQLLTGERVFFTPPMIEARKLIHSAARFLGFKVFLCGNAKFCARSHADAVEFANKRFDRGYAVREVIDLA